MIETLKKGRAKTIGFLYTRILRKLFFKMDPEKIHDYFVKAGKILGTNIATKSLTSFFFNYQSKTLHQKILGIDFKNPVGLAAGFDKDGYLSDILPSVGFGFEEIGSITGEPCSGNPKPRLWRLPESKSLLVYYGLKNEGAEKIAQRLKKKKFHIPIGISIAKTNCKKTTTEKTGIADYLKAFKAVKTIGDFIVLNISCPNAHGGLSFTDPKALENLLKEINRERKKPETSRIPANSETRAKKPIFLKLSPDLTTKELDQILEISEKYNINGFIATNLTKKRDNKRIMQHVKEKELPKFGSISGPPIREIADEFVEYLYKKTKGQKIIIGCGGVFNAKDAYRKIRRGASLVQLITGMIYEGPQLIGEINQELAELLEKDGFKNITEAIGADVKF